MIDTAGAATNFYDNFNGSSYVTLNGTTPDVTFGDLAWVASSDFKADGSVDSTDGGSTTLAFTPVNGKIYTLDCSLSGVDGGYWFALGFVSGQSTLKGAEYRFAQGTVLGKVWMLMMGSTSESSAAFLGSETAPTLSKGVWVTYPKESGDMLMRIVLDTTGGSGNWKATWYAKKPIDTGYSVVRSTATILSESINSVGIAIGSPAILGTIESFSLSDNSISLDAGTTSAITTNSALASATVTTNLTEAVLVWDTVDQGLAGTNVWSYHHSFGPSIPGVVSGSMTNLMADTRYSWRLYGINSSNEFWSQSATFATALTDAQKPVFTGAAALTPNIIQLNWQDNASTETAYVLQRSTAAGSGYVTVAILGAGITSYTDKGGLDDSTVYYYQLAATNTVNNSGTDFALCPTNAMTGSWTGQGALRGPYKADADTLHLWHMDEAAPGPVQPASGVTGSFSLAPVSGATLGNAAYPEFGTAGDTSAISPSGFQGSSIPVSSVTGAEGAFTFEAMVRVATITAPQQVISMEKDTTDNHERPFQFRIGGTSAGLLYFINIAGSIGVQNISTPIPFSGEHAFVPHQWFHVAVTYNGSENTPDNIKFYWTRVDARPFQANEILSATMTEDLTGASTVLGVGNEFRGTPENNIEGQIDEVRISDIARAPDQMMFYRIAGTIILVQ